MASAVNPARRYSVVRVIARLNVGGPALHALNLSQGLTGYPTLLITGTVAKGEADLTDQALARGIDIVRLPHLGRELNPISDLRVAWQLYRILRRERPAIVHTHTAKAGFVGRVAAVAARVPVRVHTFHGHVFFGYFSPWKTALFIRIERLLARFTTRIVAISTLQADDLAVRFRIARRDRIRVIPLGLELDRFTASARDAVLREELRREIGATDGEKVVVIVGRLEPIKNHALLLDAAKRILETGRRVRFVVVGGGTLEADLHLRARALGISEHLTFLGWRTDLERIYAGADVVALTSINEGTPVCLIEALAADTPVVARDVGGVRDVLNGNVTGQLVTGDDPGAFAESLISVLDSPPAPDRPGAIRFAERYGIARLLRDVSALYDELLSSRGILPPASPPS